MSVQPLFNIIYAWCILCAWIMYITVGDEIKRLNKQWKYDSTLTQLYLVSFINCSRIIKMWQQRIRWPEDVQLSVRATIWTVNFNHSKMMCMWKQRISLYHSTQYTYRIASPELFCEKVRKYREGGEMCCSLVYFAIIVSSQALPNANLVTITFDLTWLQWTSGYPYMLCTGITPIESNWARKIKFILQQGRLPQFPCYCCIFRFINQFISSASSLTNQFYALLYNTALHCIRLHCIVAHQTTKQSTDRPTLLYQQVTIFSKTSAIDITI